MVVAAVVIVVGMATGALDFGALVGIGVAYAGGVGLVCAACAGGDRPTICDSANIRNHWRGHLQVAAGITVVGIVGAVATSLLS